MAPALLACRIPACPLLPPLHHLPAGWFLDKFIAHQKVISRALFLEKFKGRSTIPQGFSGRKAAKESLEALHRGAHIYTYVKRTIVWGK